MPVDRDTANQQWEICPRCGKKKTFEDAPSGQCPDPAKDAKGMVPMGDLEHGAYYFGTCRNAQVARWNADTQRFVYVRVKFNEVFPEEIGYWIDAKPGEKRFDEFRPYGKVENPPFEIQMRVEGREWDRHSTLKGKIRAGNDRPLKRETKVFKFDRKKQAKLRTGLLHALAQGGFWCTKSLMYAVSVCGLSNNPDKRIRQCRNVLYALQKEGLVELRMKKANSCNPQAWWGITEASRQASA